MRLKTTKIGQPHVSNMASLSLLYEGMIAGGPVGFSGGMVKREEIAQNVLQLKIVLKLSLR